MTITLPGHRPDRRAEGPTALAESVVPEAPTAARRVDGEPAVCSLDPSFDDTAWAATLGCRPVLASRRND